MTYRLRIHSVDLQDRDGFLDFLNNQAREGYEAVRVFRTCTLFRKTETPPQGYSLRFVPEGPTDRESSRTIRTARKGVWLAPVPEGSAREELDWERGLTEHYDQFAPANISNLIHRGELTVVVPIALVVLTAVRLRVSQAALEHLVTLGAVLFCLALFGFCAEGLGLAAERSHLQGLRRAVTAGQRYTTAPWLARLTPVKNAVQLLAMGTNLLVVVAAVLLFFGG